jgi:hypothetical protein
MLTKYCSSAAVAILLLARAASALVITEDFSSQPLLDGWAIFGNTNLFQWDAANQRLLATWDSREPNSYYYHPLGASLTRADAFSIAFDLILWDIASGVEPGKTTAMQIGIGFLNFAGATSPGFARGSFGAAPNVTGFDYYAAGSFEWGGVTYEVLPTAVPSFISGTDSTHYAPSVLIVYAAELPTNQTVRVTMSYSNQTARLTLATNGVPLASLPDLVLSPGTGFVESDDFSVDMFSISSYSSAGDPYNSLLAHGAVDNVVVRASLRPVSRIAPAPGVPGQVQFLSQTNWTYTLERTADFSGWNPVSLSLPGTEGVLTLQDTNPPSGRAFYRVQARQP